MGRYAKGDTWRGPYEFLYLEGRPRGRLTQLLARRPRYGTHKSEIGPLVFGRPCPRCGRVFRRGEARVTSWHVVHFNLEDNGSHSVEYGVPYVNGYELDGRQLVMFQ